MTDINAVAGSYTVSQQSNLSITKTTDVSVERRISAFSGSVVIGGAAEDHDPFAKVFDVIDISEDAQEKLIQDRGKCGRTGAAFEG